MSKKNEKPGETGNAEVHPPLDGKLRFFAKGDQLVTYPGTSTAKYVNRKPRDLNGGGAQWPAQPEPLAVEPTSPQGQRLALLCRRDACLFPADEYTARHCGVKYVPTKLVDGEHVEAK